MTSKLKVYVKTATPAYKTHEGMPCWALLRRCPTRSLPCMFWNREMADLLFPTYAGGGARACVRVRVLYKNRTQIQNNKKLPQLLPNKKWKEDFNKHFTHRKDTRLASKRVKRCWTASRGECRLDHCILSSTGITTTTGAHELVGGSWCSHGGEGWAISSEANPTSHLKARTPLLGILPKRKENTQKPHKKCRWQLYSQ